MEALLITAIITGLTGLSVAVFTHIKHSSCYGLDIETRTPPTHSPTTSPVVSPVVSPVGTPAVVKRETGV